MGASAMKLHGQVNRMERPGKGGQNICTTFDRVGLWLSFAAVKAPLIPFSGPNVSHNGEFA